jgi:hypothetical protein
LPDREESMRAIVAGTFCLLLLTGVGEAGTVKYEFSNSPTFTAWFSFETPTPSATSETGYNSYVFRSPGGGETAMLTWEISFGSLTYSSAATGNILDRIRVYEPNDEIVIESRQYAANGTDEVYFILYLKGSDLLDSKDFPTDQEFTGSWSSRSFFFYNKADNVLYQSSGISTGLTRVETKVVPLPAAACLGLGLLGVLGLARRMKRHRA